MRIVMSSGHGLKIRGARGNPVPPQVDEVDSARLIVNRTAAILNASGVSCATLHDDVSTTQDSNLRWITDHHNALQRDIDVSVHLNAYDHSAHGTEVLYASDAGQPIAKKVCDAICAATGYTNRGAKHRSDLYVLNNTDMPCVLLECFFCDHTGDCQTFRNPEKFEAMCLAIAEALSGQEAQPGPTPPIEPERPPVRPPPTQPPVTSERRTLGKGDKGDDVAELQDALGVLLTDGDFGGITETWVKAFQAACGLKADGVVGPITWDEVDKLEARATMGEERLPRRLVDQIVSMAEQSEIQEYLWPDRGMTPPGYIPGMALSFAYARLQFQEGDDAATVMCKAVGNPDKDALAYYTAEFKKIGIVNTTTDQCLRSLFTMMIGLGPRESSARYVEGRDLSAGSSSMSSDTCEAGLFQTSANIKAFSPTIEPLLDDFWQNPNGFREQFKVDVFPTADNLNCYGSGDGVRYQWLSRFAPLYHVMVTGVGMRTGRAHWGPIGRREVTLKKEADDLLKEIERLVDAVA